MTQRVDLATVMDQLAIDALITDYARAVDDGDWGVYRGLFSPDGRADYSSAGGVEGAADEVADWMEQTLRLFPMRQHLIVNRSLRFDALDGDLGDTAQVRADYYNPMRMDPESDAPDFECGGRYAFSVLRTRTGWRVTRVVVHEKWRRTGGSGSTKPTS
ncbi:nuclear transport factor 2 family protein [Streptomyces boluensis]|uniref:Nuclear transport factor 2 family protein n=1 Tax=Streptomyces boluensis TaxID=1775135 RepID=A0A964UZS6_9ACTN|nr:nuclear transport factor 2 family protein [Streptomyces boluensis]NBE55922.1 nuclear transport factor 2 family protein [Streptomyces boluensis]